jgi:hypothetical protein
LIEAKEADPNARADVAFPQAAKANKSAFYHADGTAKTVGEVYAWAVDSPGAKTSPALPAAAPQIQTRTVAANYAAMDASALFSSLTMPERSPIMAERATGASTMADISRGETYSVRTPAMAAVAPQIVPQSPALLSPGILQILATLSPAMTRRAA